MAPDTRAPAVAGRFYPVDALKLQAELAGLLGQEPAGKRTATALIAPHAGYVYSGQIAGSAYAAARIPERVIVLGPNHTGLGRRRALWPAGRWLLPGGAVPVDAELAEVARREAGLTADQQAHEREHSVEVQLPFLRALQPELKVVPICLGWLSLADCRQIGLGLARAISSSQGEVLLVASTDMSHYVSADLARQLDHRALERVLAVDPEGLYDVVTREDISMCGVIPTTVVLVAARELGATIGDLVRYGNSGEVSGDFARVVGYASAILSRC
jgi:MEMO1 family protein